MRYVWLFPFLALPIFGQQSGFSSEWEVKKMLESLSTNVQRLKPAVDQIKTADWVSKGAPDAYNFQAKTAQNELQYLLDSSSQLTKQPDKLPLALDAYFRMQSLESTLDSLLEGVRKYQNPALADLIRSVMGENSANRDRLRQYITDLATAKDQEFQIVDKEAQRCRGQLSRQPVPKTTGPKKPEQK